MCTRCLSLRGSLNARNILGGTAPATGACPGGPPPRTPGLIAKMITGDANSRIRGVGIARFC